jgi:phosphatidylserine decarboxylase
MAEAHGDQPYQSFDAFFTRPLRAGVRSVSGDRVVSPADGVLSAVGTIESSSRIVVKHQPYSVAELIGDAGDAARYAAGQFAVVYLSPRHYHRVHSPVEGTLTLVRAIPGDLFPVNSIGERYIPHLFVRNNRVALLIDTATFGRVTVVMVGATIVGRISVTALGRTTPRPGTTRLEPQQAVQRGDEIGIFHLGSTVVVLFEPGTQIQRPTGEVQYGESLLQSS